MTLSKTDPAFIEPDIHWDDNGAIGPRVLLILDPRQPGLGGIIEAVAHRLDLSNQSHAADIIRRKAQKKREEKE